MTLHRPIPRLVQGFVGLSLSVLSGCSMPDLTESHSINVVTAFDQSESARNSPQFAAAMKDICHLQSDLAQDGDVMLTILFADETEVVGKTTIANRLDALQICKRQAEQRQTLQIGKTPGTSIHKVVERVAQQMSRIEQQPDPAAATVLVLMIHANETGTTPEEFAVTAARLKQLVQQKTAIALIVGDAELGRMLDQYVLDVPIEICPTDNPGNCVKRSYEAARRSAQG